MKDIFAILKEFDMEVPDGKTEDFKKAVLENYKTVRELETVKTKLETAEQAHNELQEKYNTDISQRDNDLKDLKKQLKDAGTDKEALETLQSKFDTLSSEYETAKTSYKQEIENQRYEFLVKEATSGLEFSSNSAKKAFLADLMDNKLTVSDGALMGFNDFVEKYKAADAGAFKEPEKDQPTLDVSFSGKTGSINTPDAQTATFERPLIL